MNTNTTTTRTTTLLSALLGDDTPALPAGVVEADALAIREPDFFDDGMAFWIGGDLAIGCPIQNLAARMAQDIDASGWFARRHVTPWERGFALELHGDTVPSHPAKPDDDCYSLWRLVTDTVLVPA